MFKNALNNLVQNGHTDSLYIDNNRVAMLFKLHLNIIEIIIK